eukprot:16097_1
MGRSKRRKNATFKKKWYRMLNEHWAKEQKMKIKQIVGQDPNTVKPVIGTIDGRDWKTYFPQPNKTSGFSWLEFTRRCEVLQEQKNKHEERERKQMARQVQNTNETDEKSSNSKPQTQTNNDTKDIVMNNPYKTVNHTVDEDDDDEKW